MQKLIPLNRIISFRKLDGFPSAYLKGHGYVVTQGYARLASEIIKGNSTTYIEEQSTPCDPTMRATLEAMLHPSEVFHPVNVAGLRVRKISRPTVDRYNIVMGQMLKYMPFEGRTLLDIGCMFGYWAFGFEAAGFAVTAVDKELGNIEVCKQLKAIFESDVSFSLSDIRDLEADRSYDIVCAMNVLHYVFKDMTDDEKRVFATKMLSLARTALYVSYPYIPGKAGADPAVDFGWAAKVEKIGTPSHSYSIWEITK